MRSLSSGFPTHKQGCTAKQEGREHGGLVVEPRTPEREVGGSIPTSAVLCP